MTGAVPFPSELTIPVPADAARVLEPWSWLIGDATLFTALAVTCFGDWFLQGHDGSVFFLDATSGEMSLVQGSAAAATLSQALADQQNRERWFMPGLVEGARRSGKHLSAGQCYGWSIHPAMGGGLDVSNVGVFPLGAWASISAQIAEVAQKNKGRRIGGMTFEGDEPK